MKRTEYIQRTLAGLCGTAPATPQQYHMVSAMADRMETACRFDNE